MTINIIHRFQKVAVVVASIVLVMIIIMILVMIIILILVHNPQVPTHHQSIYVIIMRLKKLSIASSALEPSPAGLGARAESTII